MFRVLSEVLASFSKSHRNFSWNQATCFFAPEDIGSRARHRVSPLLAMVLVFAAVATLSTPAFAQVTFGTVVGTVVDSSGAVLSGATVKLTNLGTNETRSVQTGSSG